MRSEFALISAGFDKCPTLTGNGGKLVAVNSGGTALEATATISAATTFSGAITFSSTVSVLDASFSIKDNSDTTKIVQFQASGITTGNTRTLTVQDGSYTIAGTNFANTFSSDQSFTGALSMTAANKNVTLSPTGTGTVTINPATAGAMNNMVIGASTPLGATFTTLAATGAMTITGGSVVMSSNSPLFRLTGAASSSLVVTEGFAVGGGSTNTTTKYLPGYMFYTNDTDVVGRPLAVGGMFAVAESTTTDTNKPHSIEFYVTAASAGTGVTLTKVLTLGFDSVATFTGAVAVQNAFTSLGIDDNATAEVLELDDLTIDVGQSGSPLSIRRNVSDQNLLITGSSTTTTGANIILYGSTHATLASDFQIRTGTTNVIFWDDSATTLAITAATETHTATAVTWSGNPTHSGNHTFSGAVTASSTLGVTGNFAVNTNKFTVTASSGNTLVAGTLSVTGDVAVNTNKFTVTASSGNTLVAGTLTVSTLTSGRIPLVSTSGLVTDSATFTYTDTAATREIKIDASGSTACRLAVIQNDIGSASLNAQVIGTGDAYVLLQTAINDWYVGIDNSASDQFIIGTSTPGSADKVTITTGGVMTVAAGTATPAGGSTSARLLFGTTAGFGIYYGSNAPTVSAAQGSLYLRSNGNNTSTRAYINTDGATTWTALTTAA